MCVEPVTVSCKVEQQPSLGAGTMTRSELAREWISTMARPGSRLARLRVSAHDQTVLMCQRRSLKDLTNEGLKMNFK